MSVFSRRHWTKGRVDVTPQLKFQVAALGIAVMNYAHSLAASDPIAAEAVQELEGMGIYGARFKRTAGGGIDVTVHFQPLEREA